MYQSAENTISHYLDSGERLLWAGQPRGGIRLRGQDVFLIPFSLLWGGFAIFWEFMAVTMIPKHGPAGLIGMIFPLFGIPFVLIGLFLIFGRFFADARSRERTFYGVTNERIIIVSGLFSTQVRFLQLRALPEISLSQRGDGSGTISFGTMQFGMPFNPTSAGFPTRSRYAPPAFDLIERAGEVYNIIRDAQRTAQ